MKHRTLINAKVYLASTTCRKKGQPIVINNFNAFNSTINSIGAGEILALEKIITTSWNKELVSFMIETIQLQHMQARAEMIISEFMRRENVILLVRSDSEVASRSFLNVFRRAFELQPMPRRDSSRRELNLYTKILSKSSNLRKKGKRHYLFDRSSLQALLNERRSLLADVQRHGLAMHKAQCSESAAFIQKENSFCIERKYKETLLKARQATEQFVSAVMTLRNFRSAPTEDPQLRRTFLELETLERTIQKTKNKIHHTASSGRGPDEFEHRKLRLLQTALRAFLQRHDATLPMHIG